jgi:hypothetical protein
VYIHTYIHEQAGDATIHDNRIAHGVSAMLSGTRYSLILFFDSKLRRLAYPLKRIIARHVLSLLRSDVDVTRMRYSLTSCVVFVALRC